MSRQDEIAGASRIHYRTCNLCEALCGLAIEVEGDAVVRIKGDTADEFSRGYHCIKGETLADLHADPQRLKQPLRRTKTGWETIAWDTAYDEVAENLSRIQQKYGRDAVASYIGNPNVHNLGSLIFLQGFLKQLRTKNRFAATSVDQLPHHMVAYFLFGHQLLLPVPDIDRTEYMLILGANPMVSRGSMMTAPDITKRLQAVRERGGRLVLIDPRKNETAAIVDRHHFIRPGTDAALLLALLHVVVTEKLINLRHLSAFTEGLSQIYEMVGEFTPERAADVTSIDADAIRLMAREFAGAKAAVCYGRVGVSTQEFGAVCQWLITILNILTGNLDRAGGAMFTTPAFDPLPNVSRGNFARWRSRVRGLPEFAGELPVATLADEILTPGEGQIKALFTSAGNPVLSTPQGNRLETALAGLEYMVSVDIYLNETTRFAQHILPPTGSLEHENYDAGFHVLAVRNTAKFSPACFEPAQGSQHDWQILSALQRRLMSHGPVMQRLKSLATRVITPELILDLGLRFGPYGARLNPASRGLTLRKLKKYPHGLDFGPLEPRLPNRLFTKTRRIDLAPEVFLDDLKRVRERLFSKLSESSAFDLRLIGRRQVRVNNSWMGHFERLTRGKATCTALMHRDDAEARGIKTGDHVHISSRVGRVTLPVVVVDNIMPGVVSIPHGFGHTRTGTGLTFSDHAKGISVNDLTDAEFVDALSGNAAFSGVPIKVERL